MMHDTLKRYFDEKGITQQQVADNLGVSLQYVNQLLNGRKTLGKKNAERLANLYGLSKPFLLTGEGDLLPTGAAAATPTPEPQAIETVNMLEIYAQRIRLVDDLRQSLQSELETIRTIKAELSAARDDFRDAAYRLRQAADMIKLNYNPTIGLAAEENP